MSSSSGDPVAAATAINPDTEPAQPLAAARSVAPETVLDEDGCRVLLHRRFVPEAECAVWMDRLVRTMPWTQPQIVVYGRLCEQHRLLCFFGDRPIRYSGLTLAARPLPAELNALMARVNALMGTHFNSCLLNYYRDGSDYMSYHRDNERELGENNAVAGVSFGCVREIRFKRLADGHVVRCALPNGSLLAMTGATQERFLHGIPQTKLAGPRISLTFRLIRCDPIDRGLPGGPPLPSRSAVRPDGSVALLCGSKRAADRKDSEDDDREQVPATELPKRGKSQQLGIARFLTGWNSGAK